MHCRAITTNELACPCLQPSVCLLHGAVCKCVCSLYKLDFCMQPSESSLLVCSFSPDSTVIAAGCSDSHVYVWHWDPQPSEHSRSAGGSLVYHDQTLSAAAERSKDERDVGMQPWAQPQEICRLAGHTGPVMMLQFSHDGLSIATGSKDGSVQVRASLMMFQSIRGCLYEAWSCCMIMGMQENASQASSILVVMLQLRHDDCSLATGSKYASVQVSLDMTDLLLAL